LAIDAREGVDCLPEVYLLVLGFSVLAPEQHFPQRAPQAQAIVHAPPQLPAPSFARPIAVKRTIPMAMRTSWTEMTMSTIRQTRLGRASGSADSGVVAIASLTEAVYATPAALFI